MFKSTRRLTAALLAAVLAMHPASMLAGEIGSTQEPAGESREEDSIFDDSAITGQDAPGRQGGTEADTCTVTVLVPKGDGLAAVITGDHEAVIKTEGSDVYVGGAKQDPKDLKRYVPDNEREDLQQEISEDAGDQPIDGSIEEGADEAEKTVPDDDIFDDSGIDSAESADIGLTEGTGADKEELRYIACQVEAEAGSLVGISAQCDAGIKEILAGNARIQGFEKDSLDYTGTFTITEDTVIDISFNEAEELEEEVIEEDTGDLLTAADLAVKEVPSADQKYISAADAGGEAAKDEKAAQSALDGQEGDLDLKEVSRQLFKGSRQDDGPYLVDDLPRQIDGSNIESISAKWLTPDTTDNGDASLLYYAPTGDEEFSVRLQINYALSGEHNYEPGDIVISVPAYIIKDRQGRDYGPLLIPYAEDPSTKNDFNWKLIGDKYYLTSTKRMSAATKGYIQFALTELVPHELIDMKESLPFDATIEVVSHRGNLMALRSNALTCQFDTEARITDVFKKASDQPSFVDADRIPEEMRVPGEDRYVVARWYCFAKVNSNTVYDLDVLDTMPDEYDGFLIKSGELTVEEGQDGLYKGGTTKYYYFETAYPASQFQPDTDYYFHNNVKFTVTEKDPEVTDPVNPNVNGGQADPQLVTFLETPAQVKFRWTMPEWRDPTGHFMIEKNGNDNLAKDNYTHRENLRDPVNDNHLWSKWASGYYGIYPSALNKLRDGETVNVSYTIDTVGYIMPWTYEPVEPVTQLSSRMISNYFRNNVRITTTDTGMSFAREGDKLTVHEDYDLTAVQFPDTMWIYTGVPQNINEDGSWQALTAGDGTFKYTRDNDMTHYPDVVLEILRNGEWEEWAACSWKDRAQKVTRKDGTPVDGNIVPLPEGTENIRTIVDFNRAAIDYDIRVYADIYPTEQTDAMIEEAFRDSYTARSYLWNGAELYAEYSPDNEANPDKAGEHIVTIENDGFDELDGYTVDTFAYPFKSAKTGETDVDYEARNVRIHYSAKVEERSVIQEEDIYRLAIEEGELDTESHGIWYDLLPLGMYPDLSTVKLRRSDSITDVYTVENYKGSGRTLLVVEGDFSPEPQQYQDGNVKYWMDVPSITFDAIYDMDDMAAYGDYVHNVIAFESSNETIGTIEHYQAEYGSDIGERNVFTADAFADNDEKGWMTGLNPQDTDPSFLFAGVFTDLDILSAARTSLSKDVMVNNDGIWGTGVYYDDPEANKMTVYTGGTYTYRLHMMSDSETISKDLILYDSLENFYAGTGNDAIDIDAPRWQGRLKAVDTTQLSAMGIAPVVYYSTVEDLQLSDETDPNKGNPTNLDLNNTQIWVRASDYNGSLDDVKAVAIDATKNKDGSDFQLMPEQSMSVILRMQAPDGQEASDYIAQKGVWGDSAHAYNNVYLTCTSIDVRTQEADSDNFVRKDYTKIGLEEYSITVKKIWDDDDDRDGIRPEAAHFILAREGQDLQEKDLPAGQEQVVFENLPYTDPEGNPYHYTVRESVPEGYKASQQRDGSVYTFTNRHEPEKTRVEGKKIWSGKDAGARPLALTVDLYADGEKKKSRLVTGLSDEWAFVFEDLPKYRDGGIEIVYTVDERASDKLDSYVKSIDGYEITNTYHPYGDLLVSKQVQNTTEVSEETEFTFTFNFIKDGEPIFDQFDYKVMGGGETISEGTLSTSSQIAIKGGQKIFVKEIPEGVEYQVTESENPGFTLASHQGSEGTISPNKTAPADFVNVYGAKGRNSLSLQKKLLNRALNKYQFRFVIEDEEGNVIKKASSGMPDQVNERPDGTVESSLAAVNFGAFTYTQEDHGRTFVYTLKEEDLEKPGYTYDGTVYTAEVTVTDNGDGTLDIQTVYKKDGQPIEGSVPLFENEYKAQGSIALRCWKDLRGRKLNEGEFTFELTDEQGQVLQEASNTEDGTITFGAISFDEKDVGKSFIYGVREKEGEDQTVNYDGSFYGFKLTVVDNGDGTLSLDQKNALPQYEGEALTGWEEADPAAIIFVNTLKDGSLSISKTVENPDQADPAQEFRFRVKLIGDIEDGELEYELSQLPEDSSEGQS